MQQVREQHRQIRKNQIEEEIRHLEERLSLLRQELERLQNEGEDEAYMDRQTAASYLQQPVSYFHGQFTAQPLMYNRRTGSANMRGELFEVNKASLLFVRGLFETDGFYLATNVREAGEFDDIVFKFKDKNTQLQHTCFLQLKTRMHNSIRRRALSSITGDFSLLKYYTSYCEIKEEFVSQRGESVLFGGLFENCEFILYTNTNFEFQDSWNEITSDGSPDTMLNTEENNGQVFQLQPGSDEGNAFSILESYITELREITLGNFNVLDIGHKLDRFRQLNKCKQLLSALRNREAFMEMLQHQIRNMEDRATWEQFLRKLRVYTSQAIEDDLEDAVKRNLERYYGISGDKTQEMFIKLKEGMIEWWRKGTYFLTENYAPFWDASIKEHISDLEASLVSKMVCVAGLRFESTQDVSIKDRVTHIVSQRTTLLSCLKVQQKLKGVGHIMIDSTTLQSRLSEVLALWGKRTVYNFLVVEGGICSANITRKIGDILQSHPVKQLIVIVDSPDAMTNRLCHLFQSESYTDNCAIKQLDEQSQEKVLGCIVNFQGFPIPFEEIIADNEELEDRLNADCICQVLSLNCKLGDTLSEEYSLYIPRSLQYKHSLDMKGLDSTELRSHIAISGISKDELDKLVSDMDNVGSFDGYRERKGKLQYIIIEGENDFNRIAKKRTSVHWLEVKHHSFVWKQSKGDINLIQTHLNNDILLIENVDSIMNVPHSTVIISAEPGMGKSTLLTHLALGTKKSNPVKWVIRVNLNDVTQQLQDMPENLLLSDVIEFLLHASGIRPEWKDFFRHKLELMENIYILFDGFDEITLKLASKVIVMLKCLHATEIEKLWVTTRLERRKILEINLSTLSFTLRPFSELDQKNFLAGYWKRSIKNIENFPLDMFIDKLLPLIVKNLDDKERQFTGIPLQSLLLAEAFEKDLSIYVKKGEFQVPQKFDLLHLYNKFVERKWEIYYKKNRVDLTNMANEDAYEQQRNHCMEKHMNLALVMLLSESEIETLDPSIIEKSETFINDFEKGAQIGIITEISKGKPVFIHRTFSEYFTALWFADNYGRIQEYLKKKWFDSNSHVIRHFFDRILACGKELHNAVFNQNLDKVRRLSVQIDYVDEKDRGGRTALHLAMINYLDGPNDLKSQKNEIVRSLLESGSQVGIEDKVLCWRPLRYLDEVQNIHYNNVTNNLVLSAINLMLQHDADSSDLFHMKEKVCNDEYVQNVLSNAVQQGLENIVGFMLDNGININYKIRTFDGGKKSLLVTAYECRQQTVMEFLLDRGADIDEFDNEGLTVLHRACKLDDEEFVQFLKSRGANINAHNSDGDTALHLAATSNNIKFFEHLIHRGCNIDLPGKFGNTVLHEAVICNNMELVRLAIHHKAELTKLNNEGDSVLHIAARLGKNEFVKEFLRRGLDVNYRNGQTEGTPLLAAALKGHKETVELLLEEGADIHAYDKNFSFVLHCAAVSRTKETVEYLLNRNLDVDCVNITGENPLHLAVSGNSLPVVRLLVERKADVNVQDGNGNTPLHVAYTLGSEEIIKFLLNHGARPDIKNSHGEIPEELSQ